MNGQQNIVSKNFVKVVRQLKSGGQIDTYTQFARSLDYSPQSLNEILKGRRDVTIEVLRKLFIHYQINPIEIFDVHPGQTVHPAGHTSHSALPAHLSLQTVRLIENLKMFDWMKNYNDPEFYNELPVYQIPWEKPVENELICIRYTEDMMHPTLQYNDWLLLRSQTPETELKAGRIYVIISSQGLLIRRLKEIGEHPWLLLQSDNLYQIKQKVNRQDILAIYEVEGRLTHSLSRPAWDKPKN